MLRQHTNLPRTQVMTPNTLINISIKPLALALARFVSTVALIYDTDTPTQYSFNSYDITHDQIWNAIG